MTKDDIITLPNSHLRERSKKVGVINDEIKQIIKNMEEATLSWEDSRDHEVGVALAAVQIDKLDRIVIIRNNFEDKTDREFSIYINPEIVKLDGDIIEDYEGCLSIKNIYGRVPRYSKVKVKAKDINGREIRVTAEGFLARVFQHEIDHTKGIVFVDHIKNKKDAFFKLEADGNLSPLDYEKEISKSQELWG